MIPSTTYVELNGLKIAYQSIGSGHNLVLSTGGFQHVDNQWEDPAAAVFMLRLARFVNLIRFDPLGAGASDREVGSEDRPDFATQLALVLDNLGVDNACLIGMLDAGPGVIAFAAAHPERVSGLILYCTTARFKGDVGYEIGLDEENLAMVGAVFESAWGTDAMVPYSVPSKMGDERFAQWYSKYLRAAGTPTEVRRRYEDSMALDVRHLLPKINVPTLVMHREHYGPVPLSHGKYLAEHIPNAEIVVVPGADGPVYWETPDLILHHIERFVTGTDSVRSGTRSVQTLLFTDIADSTRMVSEVGDRDWSAIIEHHDQISKKWAEHFAGRVVKGTGDGILAVFPTPSDAVMAGDAIRRETAEMSIHVRTGIHTGEVEIDAEDVRGLGVHIAARVMAEAGPDEILVSRTVKDLMAGSQIGFSDAGVRNLKGVEGEWALFSVSPTRDPLYGAF